MSNLEQVVLSTISDLFINISAGFFGASIFIPSAVVKTKKISIRLLLYNFTFAIIFILFAIKLKLEII